MPEFQSVRFSDRGQGLFGPDEIEELMRVEFDRAQRHNYPIVCMMIAVDRIDQLQDLYGYESKDEILRAVVTSLRESLRDSDCLGALSDDRLLAIYPHTTPETGALLSKRLLSNAKRLRFERDGRTLRVSLSIGVAHNRHEHANSFETLIHVAEEGLHVADAGGGDRYVETELYQLYEKKRRARERRQEGSEAAAAQPAPIAPVYVAPPRPMAPIQLPSTPKPEDLTRTLLDILVAQGLKGEDLAGLDPDTIAAAIRAYRLDRSAVPPPDYGAEKQAQIDLLERRVAKLTHLLGMTEEELRHLAKLKGVEFGLSSVYRDVQGLTESASQVEMKRVLMREIFDANLKLKKLTDPGAGTSQIAT